MYLFVFSGNNKELYSAVPCDVSGSVCGDSSKYKFGSKLKDLFPQAENSKYNQWRWQH